MINPMRGEAALGEHKLIVNFNRFCALEAVTEKKVPELVVMMKTGIDFGFSELRQFIRHFIDKPMTDEEAGDLIERLGMIEVPIPAEQQRRGEPKTAFVWLASDALGKAIDGFLAPPQAQKENPLKAA